MKTGRYFITPLCDPYYNMALDEWLFFRLCNRRIENEAILRLYSWKTEAITIGYNQDISKTVDRPLLDRNVPIIKRITGGRAIYHDLSEITFSLIIGLDIMPDRLRSLSETNRLISQTLVNIFREIGIVTAWEKKSQEGLVSVDRRRDMKSCFNSVSRYELTAGRTKIAAGAQRRKGDYMIHQGSIKISGLAACPAIGQKADFTIMSNRQIVGKIYSIDDISNVFCIHFSDRLGIDFKSSWFSSSEKVEIANYIKKFREKYYEKDGIN